MRRARTRHPTFTRPDTGAWTRRTSPTRPRTGARTRSTSPTRPRTGARTPEHLAHPSQEHIVLRTHVTRDTFDEPTQLAKRGRRLARPRLEPGYSGSSHPHPHPPRGLFTCTFTARDGRAARREAGLSLDDGFALTHSHPADRIRLALPNNQLAAEELYGRDFMARARRRGEGRGRWQSRATPTLSAHRRVHLRDGSSRRLLEARSPGGVSGSENVSGAGELCLSTVRKRSQGPRPKAAAGPGCGLCLFDGAVPSDQPPKRQRLLSRRPVGFAPPAGGGLGRAATSRGATPFLPVLEPRDVPDRGATAGSASAPSPVPQELLCLQASQRIHLRPELNGALRIRRPCRFLTRRPPDAGQPRRDIVQERGSAVGGSPGSL